MRLCSGRCVWFFSDPAFSPASRKLSESCVSCSEAPLQLTSKTRIVLAPGAKIYGSGTKAGRYESSTRIHSDPLGSLRGASSKPADAGAAFQQTMPAARAWDSTTLTSDPPAVPLKEFLEPLPTGMSNPVLAASPDSVPRRVRAAEN